MASHHPICRGLTIDPGTKDLGFTYFQLQGDALHLGEYGTFRAKNRPLEYRLHQIYHEVGGWMAHPLDIVVVENSFANPRHPSAITLREALGLVKVQAVDHGIPIQLFRPEEAKLALLGKRSGSKIEVAQAVEALGILLPYPAEELVKKNLDHVTDALAMTIAYGFQQTPSLQIYDEKGERLCGLSKPVPKKKTSRGKHGTSRTTPA